MEFSLATAIVLVGAVLLTIGVLALTPRIWSPREKDEQPTQDREGDPLT